MRRLPIILRRLAILFTFAALAAAALVHEHPQVSQPAPALPAPAVVSRGVGGPIDDSGAGVAMTQRLAEIAAQLAPGRLGYRRPSKMAVGEEVTVSAALMPLTDADLSAVDERLAQTLESDPGSLRQVGIEAAAVMVASLQGDADAFLIQPLHGAARQALLPGQPTEWLWQVRALQPGEHSLTLALSAVVRVGNGEETLEETYQDRIRVHIDPAITTAYLANRYWLALVLGVLATVLSAGSLVARRLWLRHEQRALSRALAVADPKCGEGYVFVSYSRKDQRFAIPLARDLMERGVRVWIDQREIHAGENWMEHIAQGIDHTDALLVVLSPRAAASAYVAMEINHALVAGKTIFPVIHRICQPPPSLEQIHAIDFTRDYASALDRLVADIASKGIRS